MKQLHPTIVPKIKFSYQWTRDFLVNSMGISFSYRKATTSAGTLPVDANEQILAMKYRIAIYAHTYNIHSSLIVGFDQTGINLVPMTGARNWVQKGSHNVKLLGTNDKRQITVVIVYHQSRQF